MIPPRKVQKAFSRGALTYARHAALQKEVSHRLVAQFAAPAAPPRRILDIGCGTGFTALDALRRWPGAKVAAIDIAPPMARETRNAGIGAVAVADAAAPPFKDGAFDLIISSLAFQWTALLPGFFAGIARLLAPGGRLAFATLTEGTLEELRAAYSRACLDCTGAQAAFPPFPAAAQLQTLMAEGGLTCVTFEHERVARRYAGVDELFAALKGIGATAAGRPGNPPRRDVLAKTRRYYPAHGGGITATYAIAFFEGERG